MADDRNWDDWPACLQCGRPRQTVCPTCGGAGNRFLLAEYQAVGEPQRGSRALEERDLPSSAKWHSVARHSVPSEDSVARHSVPSEDSVARHSVPSEDVLLLCPRCDEVFGPRFYRICPACGCDAGDGIEAVHQAVGQISNRVWLVVYGLVALGGLMLFYFWLLFRGG